MKIIRRSILKKWSETPGPRNELDEIMESTLFIERIIGQQVLDPNWSWLRYAHIQILAICLIIYVFFGTLEVLKSATEITMYAEGCYTFVIITVLVSKVVLFFNNRHEFREAYLIAKTTLFDLINEVSTETGAFVLKRLKFVVRLLFVTVVFPLSFYIFTAIVYYVMGTRVTLSKTTATLMPMTSPYYEVGLALHAIFLAYAAFVLLVTDMWFIYLTFFFCIANDCLTKILHVARETHDTNDTYATKLNEALKKFYLAHIEQIRYFNILQKLYKWMSLIPLCQIIICECFMLLLLNQEFNWSLISFGSNILPSLFELFAYSWYGEDVKSKTINLYMALLSFDWTSMRLKDKKNFLIIVTYMNKEFGVKTAFGYDLSLLTMSSVLKASYQVFAVMNTAEN